MAQRRRQPIGSDEDPRLDLFTGLEEDPVALPAHVARRDTLPDFDARPERGLMQRLGQR